MNDSSEVYLGRGDLYFLGISAVICILKEQATLLHILGKQNCEFGYCFSPHETKFNFMLNKVAEHRPYFKAQKNPKHKTPQTEDLFLVQNITLLLTQGRNTKLFLTSLVTVIFFNSKAEFKFLDAQQLQLAAFFVFCKQSHRIPLAQCPDKRADSARAPDMQTRHAAGSQHSIQVSTV